MPDAKFYCWPEWMPLVQQDDYGYEPTDRRSRTDMEVGSVLRVNYDSDETTLDCSLILDVEQSQWFEKFERNMLNQGAKWFQMPIQIAGCISRHTVRFASRPKIKWKAPFYTTYAFKLDIQKRDLPICDEIMELLLCISPADLRQTVRNLRDFWMSLKKLQAPAWIVEEVENS